MTNVQTAARKITGLLMAMYLVILFGVVAPAHHHDDDEEHGDCVVCVIANQPFVAVASVSIVLSAVILLIKQFISPPIIPLFGIRSFDSRAPPHA